MIFERRTSSFKTGLMVATGLALLACSPAALAQATKSNLNGLKLSTGLEASFQSAHLDIKGGKMETSDPVAIKADEASIVAQSLKITDKGRIITFQGAVRVNIEPSAIRKTGN